MKREITATKDGSKTLYIKELNENYHSHHGALQEAEHVFINNGIKKVNNYEINILELGFGTGLNVLVTFNEFLKNSHIDKINYYTLEKYPISPSEIENLAYHELFSNETTQSLYTRIHEIEWEKEIEIHENFTLKKIQIDFHSIDTLQLPQIDLVYFDCFGSRVQPDLWEEPLFRKVSETMKTNGLLSTYSSKGSVQRILKNLNFDVQKVAGPPGKREMIIAWKK